ncbi:MAG TPA: DUF488 family protein [Streptosporangiaceae bacterium]|nr:DUF488 family protein [Streptosporangiaceae bacterium]
MPPDVRVRRVYDQPEPQDGTRVLVDRLWPRGLRKDAAHLDEWAKDVAPSTGLRTWYAHDPAKFTEFCRRYTAELSQGAARAALQHLAALAAAGPVTLLTATRDAGHSEAAVLASLLRQPAPGPAQDPAAGPAGAGEAACYAHLVCPECGAVTTDAHNPGCPGHPG